MIVATAVLCLAANVYYEARDQLIPGQYAVALVTMNRAGTPANVCETVFARKQFSWTNKGVRRVGKGWQIRTPKEEEAWALAQKIARHTLAGRMPDITWGATHYHTTAVKPIWRLGLTKIRRIGAHVFYS